MKRKLDVKKICMTGCMAVLVFFMVMAGLKIFTRKILVERYEMNNLFIKIVYWGNETLYNAEVKNKGDKEENIIEIDWEKRYPFSADVLKSDVKREKFNYLQFADYVGLVDLVKEKFQNSSGKNLFGYSNMVACARKYEDLFGWSFASYSEYNGAQKMADGYWTEFQEKAEMEENAESVIRLGQYCKSCNVDFLYVQAPYKISKYEDKDIYGAADFSNQNADDLLKIISEAGVSVYDLREVIHEEKLDHHKLFFKTDHHWLQTTGLWAAGKIMQYCSDNYGYHVNTSLFKMSQFKVKEYPKWFLGSYGKRVTLVRTEPDDFSLLYPKYLTDFHYVIPSRGIDQRGNFSITYDMGQVSEKDYYDKDPYGAYNYGSQPLIQIENMLDVEKKKMLLIKDSFSNCMAPFMAFGVKWMDIIDLRSFDGSLETYIKKSKPDTIILMYNAGLVGSEIDWSTHKSLFDFR